MNELLARLTNFSYELFGVLLPGVVASLFGLLLWSALGPLVPTWSFNNLPEFSISELGVLLNALGVATGIGTLIPLIVIWYFLGHLLLWIAKSWHAPFSKQDTGMRRLVLTLTLRIPKPQDPYDPNLRPLFDAARKAFSTDGVELAWRHFYPVAKSYLSRELTSSLVANYQNKYTFHRSVATASAILWWLSALGTIGGLITLKANGIQPHWIFLIGLLALSIFNAWGFSGSYLYHWEMFGNTIITEAYSLIHGPRNAESFGAKSPGHRP